eukprot:gnl/Dysnectes_brevis/4029_a5261_788.p1 GENE.gnl/Dysnectes_brevis/4029_a5261_788~~gnl/Dysnectes_brevis/4029_a5261_788.p1  ORF type:complete len:1200 (-),score=178.36 gnl/Dysnectes_brevis/4029_a5261_788:68-3667(-)
MPPPRRSTRSRKEHVDDGLVDLTLSEDESDFIDESSSAEHEISSESDDAMDLAPPRKATTRTKAAKRGKTTQKKRKTTTKAKAKGKAKGKGKSKSKSKSFFPISASELIEDFETDPQVLPLLVPLLFAMGISAVDAEDPDDERQLWTDIQDAFIAVNNTKKCVTTAHYSGSTPAERRKLFALASIYRDLVTLQTPEQLVAGDLISRLSAALATGCGTSYRALRHAAVTAAMGLYEGIAQAHAACRELGSLSDSELVSLGQSLGQIQSRMHRQVIMQAYRDVYFRIRGDCCLMLARSMCFDITNLLKMDLLRHIGWALSDEDPRVRYSGLLSIFGVLSKYIPFKCPDRKAELPPTDLSSTVERFQERILSMTSDEDPIVSLLACSIAPLFLELVSEDDRTFLFWLCTEQNPVIRASASHLLTSIAKVDTRTEKGEAIRRLAGLAKSSFPDGIEANMTNIAAMVESVFRVNPAYLANRHIWEVACNAEDTFELQTILVFISNSIELVQTGAISALTRASHIPKYGKKPTDQVLADTMFWKDCLAQFKKSGCKFVVSPIVKRDDVPAIVINDDDVDSDDDAATASNSVAGFLPPPVGVISTLLGKVKRLGLTVSPLLDICTRVRQDPSVMRELVTIAIAHASSGSVAPQKVAAAARAAGETILPLVHSFIARTVSLLGKQQLQQNPEEEEEEEEDPTTSSSSNWLSFMPLLAHFLSQFEPPAEISLTPLFTTKLPLGAEKRPRGLLGVCRSRYFALLHLGTSAQAWMLDEVINGCIRSSETAMVTLAALTREEALASVDNWDLIRYSSDLLASIPPVYASALTADQNECIRDFLESICLFCLSARQDTSSHIETLAKRSTDAQKLVSRLEDELHVASESRRGAINDALAEANETIIDLDEQSERMSSTSDNIQTICTSLFTSLKRAATANGFRASYFGSIVLLTLFDSSWLADLTSTTIDLWTKGEKNVWRGQVSAAFRLRDAWDDLSSKFLADIDPVGYGFDLRTRIADFKGRQRLNRVAGFVSGMATKFGKPSKRGKKPRFRSEYVYFAAGLKRLSQSHKVAFPKRAISSFMSKIEIEKMNDAVPDIELEDPSSQKGGEEEGSASGLLDLDDPSSKKGDPSSQKDAEMSDVTPDADVVVEAAVVEHPHRVVDQQPGSVDEDQGLAASALDEPSTPSQSGEGSGDESMDGADDDFGVSAFL